MNKDKFDAMFVAVAERHIMSTITKAGRITEMAGAMAHTYVDAGINTTFLSFVAGANTALP